MDLQFPIIIIIWPLATSFLIFLTGWWYRQGAFPLAIASLVVCLAAAGGILKAVLGQGTIAYWLGGWQPPRGIEYRIDHLNGFRFVLEGKQKCRLPAKGP